MHERGRQEIRALMTCHAVGIPSVTGDCFMQAPFWKTEGARRAELLDDFRSVVDACEALGVQFVVVPLVDDGRLESKAQEDDLVASLSEMQSNLSTQGVKIVFESDFRPLDLAGLIQRLDHSVFGINYDIGNSAALGFDPEEEIFSYGERILNVHVKDRLLGGTTVPLGSGNADFEKVFSSLGKIDYRGNYIMQTARASDGNHQGALQEYRNMTEAWIRRHGA
jgi:hexulose-6-phosphate isomerase